MIILETTIRGEEVLITQNIDDVGTSKITIQCAGMEDIIGNDLWLMVHEFAIKTLSEEVIRVLQEYQKNKREN